MPMIKFKNISFSYDEADQQKEKHYVLKDINLEISQGEWLALLGGNGSGKSTLAKLANGLLLPDEGQVTISNFDTKNEASLWEIRKRTGFVFQNPDNQMVATIVEDDVAFGLENLGLPYFEMQKRINTALEYVGMQGFDKAIINNLSGGQKQRVAIAGAIAMLPKFLVLDEPTAMLDPQGRKEVINVLKRLHDDDKGIVYVTHYIEEALLADKVAILNDGKLEFFGTKEEFINIMVQDEEITLGKKIHHWGLDLPIAMKIAYQLKNKLNSTKKLNLANCISKEKMVKELCENIKI